MYTYDVHYDVIVIGGGHAGCEAALASARLGQRTLLLTMNLDTIAQMSCNPSIGGIGKGHLVREVDALGGAMGSNTDATGIQFRLLNRTKGPAVQAPRAQCDKKQYQLCMKHVVEQQPHLDIKQHEIARIVTTAQGSICAATGVVTTQGMGISARSIIVTTGTFLRGLMHVGDTQHAGGRAGEVASKSISACLHALGFTLARLKTGTPQRLDRNTIDFSQLDAQPGDVIPQPFSFATTQITQAQLPCHITYTNDNTHQIIRNNLHRSALYGGNITGVGPRYCPSIEDKVVRFADKDRHQIFLEPEGRMTNEIYPNGLSTSLPQDVQISIIRSIKGLEKCEIMRCGYAIEYDYSPPTQLLPTMETKMVSGLYFAGQINGTTGYEEAAAQGLMAGINAARKLRTEPPLVLGRDQAYIGVLIDDLVTKGTDEPYRMFTSRAEHRMLLRHDNADMRLSGIGHAIGLLPKERMNALLEKQRSIESTIAYLESNRSGQHTLRALLRRPEIHIADLLDGADVSNIPEDIQQLVEIEIKYEGYITKELVNIDRVKRLEFKQIPPSINYQDIISMRHEAREKFEQIRPCSIGQAGRIPGVSPTDVSLLLVYIDHKMHENAATT